MKKIILIIALSFLIVGCNPDSSDAIYFVEKNIKESMKDPDSVKFDAVVFYPDGTPQGEEISGHVCGYVNGKNSFGAYSEKSRFWSKISVTNGGKSANFSRPLIESTGSELSSAAMDKLWSDNCKY